MRWLLLVLLIPVIFAKPIIVHVGDRLTGVSVCAPVFDINNNVAMNEGVCGSGDNQITVLKTIRNNPAFVNRTIAMGGGLSASVTINVRHPYLSGVVKVVDRISSKVGDCTDVTGCDGTGSAIEKTLTISGGTQKTFQYNIGNVDTKEWEFFEPEIDWPSECGVIITIDSPRDYQGYLTDTQITINGTVKDTEGHDADYNLTVDGITVPSGQGTILWRYNVNRTGEIPIVVNADSSCGKSNLTMHIFGLQNREEVKIPDMPAPVAFIVLVAFLANYKKR